MSNTEPKPWDVVKNPAIRKLCEDLQRLPEWLEAKRVKAANEREFRRQVWEQACLDAGLLKNRGTGSGPPLKK